MQPTLIIENAANLKSHTQTIVYSRGRQPTTCVPHLARQAIFNGTQSLPKLHKMFFVIHTEVAPIGATWSIKNSPVVTIEFVHNIRY